MSIFFLWFISLVACNNVQESQNTSKFLEPNINLQIQELDIVEDVDITAKIDSIFHHEFVLGEFPGAAVTILKGNQIILKKAYGYRDARKKSTLTTQSVFRIGSVSKSLTGVLAGVLYQQGKIDFEEKVNVYDQDCSLYNSEYSNELNLGHLLSHTSGLPYHSFTNLIEYGIPLHKIVCKFEEINNLEPPGSIYSYQNAAFAESGEILSRKLKMPIEDLFQKFLFEPLGMSTASTSYKALQNAKELAKPHKKSGKKWLPQQINKKYYNAIPAGGINASIEDMTKVMSILLENSPSFLSEATIDTITKPRIDTKVKYRYYKKWENFDHSFYGYGWRIHTFKNSNTGSTNTLIHHGGQVNNYRSEIAFDKENKIAICVLFNAYTTLANTIIPELLSVVREQKKGPIQEEKSL